MNSDDYLVNVKCNKCDTKYLSVGDAALLSEGASRTKCSCCSNINYASESNVIAKVEEN